MRSSESTVNGITRLGIVNRGEPAMRLLTAVAELNTEQIASSGAWQPITTVALYTDPDTDAWFVQEADEAVPLGSATYVDPGDGQRHAPARKPAQGGHASPELGHGPPLGARDRSDQTDAAGDGGHAGEQEPGVVALVAEPERVGARRFHGASVGEIVARILELSREPHADLQHDIGPGRATPPTSAR